MPPAPIGAMTRYGPIENPAWRVKGLPQHTRAPEVRQKDEGRRQKCAYNTSDFSVRTSALKAALFRAEVAAAALVFSTAPTAQAIGAKAAVIEVVALARPGPARPIPASRPPATAPRAAARPILGGVHAKRAPTELVAVELLDRLLGVFVRLELDESEATRTSALAIRWKKHIFDRTRLREERLHFIAGRLECEVTDKNL